MFDLTTTVNDLREKALERAKARKLQLDHANTDWTREDRETLCFLFDRGRVSIPELMAQCADDARDAELFSTGDALRMSRFALTINQLKRV